MAINHVFLFLIARNYIMASNSNQSSSKVPALGKTSQEFNTPAPQPNHSSKPQTSTFKTYFSQKVNKQPESPNIEAVSNVYTHSTNKNIPTDANSTASPAKSPSNTNAPPVLNTSKTPTSPSNWLKQKWDQKIDVKKLFKKPTSSSKNMAKPESPGNSLPIFSIQNSSSPRIDDIASSGNGESGLLMRKSASSYKLTVDKEDAALKVRSSYSSYPNSGTSYLASEKQFGFESDWLDFQYLDSEYPEFVPNNLQLNQQEQLNQLSWRKSDGIFIEKEKKKMADLLSQEARNQLSWKKSNEELCPSSDVNKKLIRGFNFIC